METIELLPAFEWICEECGKNNYVSAIKSEDPDLIKRFREHFDISEDKEAELLMQPTKVTCEHCSVSFDVEAPSQQSM